MKILMLETMTYGDDISLEQFNRLGEVVTYSLSSYEEAVARMKEHNPDVVIINKMSDLFKCIITFYEQIFP
jgi:DNA-binding NarL/FixJ family response regulator